MFLQLSAAAGRFAQLFFDRTLRAHVHSLEQSPRRVVPQFEFRASMGKFLVSNGASGGGGSRSFAFSDSSIQEVAKRNEIRQRHDYSCPHNKTIADSILIEQGARLWPSLGESQCSQLGTRPSQIKSAIAKCLRDIVGVYCRWLRLSSHC
jgi:hypothetical protein